jgi:hypothetical protein
VSKLDEDINHFESMVSLDHPSSENKQQAATVLTRILASRAGLAPTIDFGDSIETLTRARIPCSAEAALIVHALSIDRLFDDPHLYCDKRFIVEICERNLPQVSEFCGCVDKRQTHDKYSALLGAHSRVCAILKPILSTGDDQDSIIASRQAILSALNNGL